MAEEMVDGCWSACGALVFFREVAPDSDIGEGDSEEVEGGEQ